MIFQPGPNYERQFFPIPFILNQGLFRPNDLDINHRVISEQRGGARWQAKQQQENNRRIVVVRDHLIIVGHRADVELRKSIAHPYQACDLKSLSRSNFDSEIITDRRIGYPLCIARARKPVMMHV